MDDKEAGFEDIGKSSLGKVLQPFQQKGVKVRLGKIKDEGLLGLARKKKRSLERPEALVTAKET